MRTLLVALGVVCVGGVVAGIVVSTSGNPVSPPPSATTSTTDHPASQPTAPTAPTSASSPRAIGTFRVASTSFNVVEPTTVSGAAIRTLPTAVWYPAGQRGSFPLLLFSQGFDLSVSAYATLLEDWASAGFVVAAPTFPHTDPSQPAALDENDIVNHPADARYVITYVLTVAGQPGSVLSGLVNGNEIGVVGHSDGGDVSLAIAADPCCQDPRVKAAAILSGAELASFGGTYFSGNSVPLLVVQGSADTINPPACSVQIYDEAKAPKYYLDLLNAQHEPPYTDPTNPDLSVVAKVTTDFFDTELLGESAGAAAMSSTGNVAGATQFIVGGTAPPAPGGCPGAPG